MKTRILRIRVRNLASLAGEHLVELERGPLADAGIFPIVGPTGAGKSTLLDAICLALFARLPRLPAATKGARNDEGLSPSDPRHALRRGAGEGLAEVEFLGRDGRRYRATWSVQRARKRTDGALQQAKHVFFDVARDRAMGDGKNETKSLIEDRLGLGYEELVRSMLLPQGEFAALLRSKPDERAKLLEKLTRTTIYARLSELAGARRSEAKRVVEQLDARLGEVRALDPDSRLALEARARDSERTLDELRALSEASLRAERLLAELHRREAVLRQATADLESAKQAHADRAPLRKEVERADRCQPARVAREALTAADARLAETTQRRDDTKAALTNAGRELESASAQARDARAALEGVRARLDHLREPIRRAKQLDGELHERSQALQRLFDESQEGASTRADLERAIDATAGELESLMTERSLLMKELASGPVDDQLVARWSGIEETFRSLRAARDDVATRAQTIAARESDLDLLRATIRAEDEERVQAKALVEASSAKLLEVTRELEDRERAWSAPAQERLRARASVLQRLEDLEEELEAARRERDKLGSERATRAEAYATARVDRDRALAELTAHEAAHEDARCAAADAERAHLAQTLRAELRPGEPCPVCGGCDHPRGPSTPPDVARATEVRDMLEETLRRASAHLASCERRLATAEAEHTAAVRGETDAIDRFAKHRARVEAQRALAQLDAHDDASAALAAVKEAVAGAATELGQLEALRDERARLTTELESTQEAARALDTRQRERQVAFERCHASLEATRRELRNAESTLGAIQARLESDLGRRLHDDLEPALRAAVNSHRDGRERLLGLEKRLSELQTNLSHLRARLVDARDRERRLVEADERIRGEVATRVDERAGLLEGRPTVEVEAELDRARGEATEAHAEAGRRVAAAEASHAAVQAQLEIRLDEVEKANREAKDTRERFERTLREAELDEQTVVATLDAWPSDRIASARKELETTGELLAGATTLQERAARDLREHRAVCPDDVAEQAARRAHFDQAATEARELHERHTRELADDDTRRRRSAALLDERAAGAARLDLLEDLVSLVGSGQGASNHLSRFAQGLTLEVLVDAANTQLDRLAPRYRLRRVAASELDLELVDRDLADEARPVHGLSGGETFLVSLALALGLATLAGDELDLGSLFVDEGFGSLDPETLETALAALEAIHAEGVQVAIITHVEGLADRFAASVHVRRVAPGRSTVEVRC